MADTPLTQDTETPAENTETAQNDGRDAVAAGVDGIETAIGQAGSGESRPLEDQTQVIDDVAPGDNFVLPAGVSEADLGLAQEGGSLILTLPSGAVVTLQDFFVFQGLPPALTMADGAVMGPEDIVAAIGDFDPDAVVAAAGGGNGGGDGNASYTEYASGDIGPGDEQLGLLPGVPGFPFGLQTTEEETALQSSGSSSIVVNTTTAFTQIDGEDVQNVPGAITGSFGGAFEDSAPNQHVGVPSIKPAKVNVDFMPSGDEELVAFSITDIPADVSFYLDPDPTDGDPGMALVAVGGTVTIAPDQIDNIYMVLPADDGVAPEDDDTDIPLGYIADVIDPGTGEEITLVGTFTVVVDAVADIPDLSANADSVVDFDSVVPLNISIDSNDIDGSEVLTVKIFGVPDGATLSAGSLVEPAGEDSYWLVQEADLAGLTMDLPPSVTEGFSLQIVGVATEQPTDGELTAANNVATAETTLDFELRIPFTPQINSVDDAEVDEDGFVFANADDNRAGETDSTESVMDGGDIVVDFQNPVDVPGDLDAALVLLDTPGLDGQLQTLDGQNVTFALDSGKLVGTVDGGSTTVIEVELQAGAGLAGTEATYTYEVTLHQPVEHSNGGDDENSAVLAGVSFEVTDATGDSAQGSFDVTIVDDLPIQSDGEAENAAVEEDDLDPDGNDEDASASNDVASGSIAHLVSVGADAAGSFSLVTDSAALDAWVTGLGLSSDGVAVAFAEVSGDMLTAYAGTDNTGDAVFSLQLGADGAYTFTLLDQLDHHDVGSADDDETATINIGLADVVEFADEDGDSLTLGGGFSISVADDVPVQLSGESESGTVEEDDLDGDGNDEDASASNESTSGSVAHLVSAGADQTGSFGLVTDGTALDAWVTGLGLSSAGVDVGYAEVSGDTLTAYAGTDNTGDAVFSLQLGSDGSYTFTLLDQLDHHDAGSADDDETATISIDLSGVVAFTDQDGDAITLGGGFTVAVEDDVPVQLAGQSESAAVEEDDLDPDGNDEDGSATNDVASGSVAHLVSAGADQPGAFSLVTDGAALGTWVVGLGLSAGGVDVAYAEVSGDTLTAYAGTDNTGDAVFSLELNDDGSYTFTLLSNLDHHAPEAADDTEAATISIDLSGVVQFADEDGDAITLDGGFTVDVADDIPEISDAMGVIMASQSGNSADATYDAGFGADGLSLLSVALGSAGIGYSYATTDLGGGKTQVDVSDTDTGDGTLEFTFYTTTSDGDAGSPAVLEAFADVDLTEPFFTLTVNPDGTYSFDLHSNEFLSDIVFDFTSIGAGNFDQLFLAEGTEIEPTEFDVKIDGLSAGGVNQTVNTSTHGLATGNQNFNEGEVLIFEFTENQSEVSFDLTKWNSGTVTLTLNFYDAGGVLIESETVEATKANNAAPDPTIFVLQGTDANSDTTVYVDGEFAKMEVEYTSGSDNLNLNNLSYGKTLSVDDFTFNFDLSATDGDGDSTTLTDGIMVDLEGDSVADGIELTGSGGDEAIVGGTGPDVIAGGGGDDLLTGGGDADVFVFDGNALGGDAVITDFDVNPDGDTINLDALFDFLESENDGAFDTVEEREDAVDVSSGDDPTVTIAGQDFSIVLDGLNVIDGNTLLPQIDVGDDS